MTSYIKIKLEIQVRVADYFLVAIEKIVLQGYFLTV
tara:strand:- start:1030 stop:1137 length:108 start_codon:yes stop_codon:yes gene_type:complete